MRQALWIVGLGMGGMMAGVAQAQTESLPPVRTVEVGSNREFRVNGEPFLPIMSWAQAPRNFGMLRGLGFNTFCGRSGREPCDAAQAAGGYAVVHFGEAGGGAVGHPYLLAWIHRDEPDMPQRGEEQATPDELERGAPGRQFIPKVPPAEVAAHYRLVRETDRSRPVLVTFTGHFTEISRFTAEQRAEIYPAYARNADVLGFDIYPIYGSGRPGWLNRPAEGVAQLVALGEHRKPVYAWIETSKGSRWMTYELQPDVLPVHTRFQVWSALIEGATAIGYFTHAWQPTFREFAPEPEMREELARLNAQITRLAPAILAAPAARRVEMEIEGGLRCRVKATEHGGHLYLFAQLADLGPNADQLGQFEPIAPRGGRATFRVEGLAAGTRIEVVDEDRTIEAGDGVFTDAFAPLAEHIYRIPAGR